MIQRYVFACCNEGGDRSAWKPATETGRRGAGAKWRVAEGFGSKVDADVCRDRVDPAGGNDDRVRFCCQIVKSKFVVGRGVDGWNG